MPQRRQADLAHVVDAHRGAAVHGSERLGPAQERLSRAGAGAPVDDPVDPLGDAFLARPRHAHDAGRVHGRRAADRNAVDGALEPQQVLGLSTESRPRPCMCSRARDDPQEYADLVLVAGVVHVHAEHEPVELRLRQRDRCLPARSGSAWRARRTARAGCTSSSADGHLVLLHGLQQRGLRLRRRAVDLVGQHDVGEDRALARTRTPLGRSSSSWMTSVPVMSDGIRSGVNWMRLNSRSSTSRERADQQRLRQARHADEQAVPPREDRRPHQADDPLAGRRSAARSRPLDPPVAAVQVAQVLRRVARAAPSTSGSSGATAPPPGPGRASAAPGALTRMVSRADGDGVAVGEEPCRGRRAR